MEHLQQHTPPAWALHFFRWFCHPAFREDIEGDLVEQFHNRVATLGTRKAKVLFIKDVFFLFRSGLIRDLIGSYIQNSFIMTRKDWLKLTAVNLLVVLLILSPFIPGPFNRLVGLFSFAGQLTGLFGLLLIPPALIWTIIEIRKSRIENARAINQKAQYQLAIAGIVLVALIFLTGAILVPNPMPKLSFVFGLLLILVSFVLALKQVKKMKEKNEEMHGTRASIILAASTTACVTFLYIFTVLFVFVSIGTIPGIMALVLLPALLTLAIKRIRKMKDNAHQLNRLPLYLVTIPVSAFITFMFIIKPVSNLSRNFAIQRGEKLITAIELYKNKTGEYPSSIENLLTDSEKKTPSPFIMGVENFRYNKIENSYSISFSQWLELGSLEEIVLFDKTDLRHNLPGLYSKYDYSFDLCRVNGAFAGHDTRYDNWRYYHSD